MLDFVLRRAYDLAVMPIQRLIPAMLAVFVASFATGFLFHGVLLAPDYQLLTARGIYGGPELFQVRWICMVAAYAAFGVAMVWIYSRNAEPKPWLPQGVRFGVAVWLLYPVTSFLIQFTVQRIPKSVMLKQVGLELVDKVLLGCLTAFLVSKVASKPLVKPRAA